MQLKNLECQLALAQLKRYMGGAKLSDEALEALESHLVECTDCQAAVQAQKEARARAKSLMTHAVVESPAPTPEPQASNPKDPESPAKKLNIKGNGKILALSAGLALVLILMNSLARDPSKLFGGRAQDLAVPAAQTSGKSSAQNPTPEPAPTAEPEPVVASTAAERTEPDRAEATQTPPVTEDAPRNVDPTPAPVQSRPRTRPAPTVRRIPPRRTTAPARQPAPRAVASPAPARAPGLVIYDEQGRPIR